MKILYSPGFGAGWSSWNSGQAARIMLTYQPIIDFIEKGGEFTRKDCGNLNGDESTMHPLLAELNKYVRGKHPEESYVCILGAPDLEVEDVNAPFRIDEYDGSESVSIGTNDYICPESLQKHPS